MRRYRRLPAGAGKLTFKSQGTPEEKKFAKEYRDFLNGNPPEHWPEIKCTFTKGRMKIVGPLKSEKLLKYDP